MYKSYVCDFSSTILSNLLTPQRGYWIECNTTQVRPCSSSYPAQWRIFLLRLVSNIPRLLMHQMLKNAQVGCISHLSSQS